MRGFPRIAAIVSLVLAIVANARAADLPSAASTTNPLTRDSHSWLADRNILGGIRILHIPPRGEDASGKRGVPDGSVRVAAVLLEMPDAMAAVDARLYLTFAPAIAEGKPKRQVLMLEAQRGSLDGTWISKPEDGRLPVLPALPGDCHLQGFVGTPVGPVALIDRPGADGMPIEELLVLAEDAWQPIALPPSWASRAVDWRGLQNDDTGVRLAGTGDGIELVVVDGPKPGVWTAGLVAQKVKRGEPRHFAPTWSWQPLSFEEPEQHRRIRPPGQMWVISGQLVFDRRSYDQIELWSVSAKGCQKIANAAGVETGYAAAPLDQTGRVAFVWSERPEPGSRQVPNLRVFEVSTRTGQVLFDGDAAKQLPISSLDVKILAVFLVCVMLAIVVFVLRPDGARDALILPKGAALAEPGRRAIAGAIDAVVAIVIAAQITRIDVSESLTLDSLIRGTTTLWLMLSTIGIGFVLGTLGEWLFGRSLGKALTGCEVAVPSVSKLESGEVLVELKRVAIWRAAVRNLVKWLIPPVAMSGVSSAEGRHRGDTAAGTVVIVRSEPEED